MAEKTTHICDACCFEVSGATRQELVQDGWKWKSITGRKEAFVMCDECVKKYEAKWAAA